MKHSLTPASRRSELSNRAIIAGLYCNSVMERGHSAGPQARTPDKFMRHADYLLRSAGFCELPIWEHGQTHMGTCTNPSGNTGKSIWEDAPTHLGTRANPYG